MKKVGYHINLVTLFVIICLNCFGCPILPKCQNLNKYQYQCRKYPIDPKTQQSVTCAPDDSIQMMCETPDYIDCIGKDEAGFFNITVENGCHHSAHISYSTAVLLSIFLGFFGADRIYLGYYAIGFFKMFSLGGLFVFWLVDIILITLQLLEPADGSSYQMYYFGPKVSPIRFDSHTNYSIYTCNECL